MKINARDIINIFFNVIKYALMSVCSLFLAILPIFIFILYYMAIFITSFHEILTISIIMCILYVIMLYIIYRSMNISRVTVMVIFVFSCVLYINCYYFDFFNKLFNVDILPSMMNAIQYFINGVYSVINALELDEDFFLGLVEVIGFKELMILTSLGLISYVALLQLFRKRGYSVYGFENGESKVNDYSVSIPYLYDVFNRFLYFALVTCLLTDCNRTSRYIELFILFIMFYVNYILFSSVSFNYKKIIRNYSLIESLSGNLMPEMIKGIYQFSAFIFRHKILKDKKIETGIVSTIKKDGLANFFRTIIEILPFNTSFNNLINAFPVAIFSFLVLGYILSFNFLSMAYIILTLTVWYFYLCIARNLPKYKSNIKLSDDHGHFSDVYIIDEHSKDYITIIGKDNNIKKIMKSAVISIERPKNDNNSGIVKEIITLQRPNKA